MKWWKQFYISVNLKVIKASSGKKALNTLVNVHLEIFCGLQVQHCNDTSRGGLWSLWPSLNNRQQRSIILLFEISHEIMHCVVARIQL